MAKSHTRRHPAKRVAESVKFTKTGTAMASAWEADVTSWQWDTRWGAPMEAAAIGITGSGNVNDPPGQQIFAQARRWFKKQVFCRQVLLFRQYFLLAGVLGKRQLLKNPKKPDGEKYTEYHPGIQSVNKGDREKLNEWKKKNRTEIAEFILNAVLEWLVLDNVITVWRKAVRGGAKPIIYPPEKIAYKDIFGVEELTIMHGMSREEVEKIGLSQAEKDMLTQSQQLKLTHDNLLFSFRVLKRERVGMGLAWPGLGSIFDTNAAFESLEIGDRQLSDVCRTVIEQHKLGHEIKNGPHAGYNTHFWKQKRADAVIKAFKGKKGHIQTTSNFDHDINQAAGRPDPKYFASSRYDAAIERIALWAMPLGHMLLNKAVNPFLTMLLRSQVKSEREMVEPYLESILLEAMKCPCDIQFGWDESLFWDSRLFLDVLKTGLASGPLSQQSWLEKTGISDSPTELERKTAEAELPKDLKTPAFDAAHGEQKPGGKPPGTKDQE